MPNFFLPYAKTAVEAEETYQGFLKAPSTYPLAYPNTRLFRIAFKHHGGQYVAEIGKEITNWPEAHGPVLAIVETTRLITVHTQRSVVAGDQILVSPEDTSDRAYFENYGP